MGDEYYYKRQYRKAYDYFSEHFKRLEEAGLLNPNYMHRMGHVLWNIGNKEEAMEISTGSSKLRTNPFSETIFYGLGGAHYDLAGVYTFLGENDKAYEHLDESLKGNHQIWFIRALKQRDPLFESIRQRGEVPAISQRGRNQIPGRT